MSEEKKILKLFVGWRVLLFIPLIIGFYYLPYRNGYEYTHILSWFSLGPTVKHFLIFPWANFDGVRYLSIAVNGYITEAAFFPLYPLLIKYTSILFTQGVYSDLYFWIGFLISNIAIYFGLLYFYRLVGLDHSKKIPFWSVLFLLAFPTAFFFGGVYSESIFFLLLILSFYFARKGSWKKATLFALLLSLTRFIGVFILPALLLEFYLQKGLNKKTVKESLFLLIIPLGTLVYGYYNYIKWGNWLHFLEVHGQLGNSRAVNTIVLFPQTMYRYLKILITLNPMQHEWFIAFIELSLFIFVGTMLFIALKKGVRISYLVFSVLTFIVPASSGTFTGLPRYALICFPIYIAMATIKGRKYKYLYISVAILLQLILLTLFSRGYFVA